jgi:ATP-binding cassette subfamily B protein
LLAVNYQAASVIIVFALIYVPILSLLLKKQLQLQEEYVKSRQETVGIINDSIANMFGIKIIGNVWTEFKLKLTPAILRWCNWDRETRKYDAYYVDLADTVLITIMGAAQIGLLAYLYKTGQITAGDFAFISMITLNIHKELDFLLENILFSINPKIATMKSSYRFINMRSDVVDMDNATLLPRVKGDIKYEHVAFGYGTGANVFSDLTLHIKPGQRLGIVGTSGAGKTTLIKCLLRYFDLRQGRILVDGHDISQVTQESLSSNISIIPQDITMFHRTILENLQLAKYDASLAEIQEVCKKAKIHDDIERMPNGYNSIVGERGAKVSGGQRQRIAIARAILKNAPILILDEATSALDTPTEQLIQESINEVLATCHSTTIVIAHRLSTLLHMDRILVFEQGKIVESGTHKELLEEEGLYKNLWNTQVRGFLP